MDVLADVCSGLTTQILPLPPLPPPVELQRLKGDGHQVLREYQGSYIVKKPRERNMTGRKLLPWEGKVLQGDCVFEVEVERRVDLEEEVKYEKTPYRIGFYALLDMCLYFGLVRDDIDHGGGTFRKVGDQGGERRINTVLVTGKLSRGLPWGEGGTKVAFLSLEVVKGIVEDKGGSYIPLYRVLVTRTRIGSVRPKKRKKECVKEEGEEEEEGDI
jgi:hypothetical protein